MEQLLVLLDYEFKRVNLVDNLDMLHMLLAPDQPKFISGKILSEIFHCKYVLFPKRHHNKCSWKHFLEKKTLDMILKQGEMIIHSFLRTPANILWSHTLVNKKIKLEKNTIRKLYIKTRKLHFYYTFCGQHTDFFLIGL